MTIQLTSLCIGTIRSAILGIGSQCLYQIATQHVSVLQPVQRHNQSIEN